MKRMNNYPSNTLQRGDNFVYGIHLHFVYTSVLASASPLVSSWYKLFRLF